MAKQIRWGIMGCGGIADKFAHDLAFSRYGRLYAAGSRSQAKANEFAARHGAERAYGSYEALAADPDVDVLYIATPHNCHLENTLLAIHCGKHVLCEKPFALNAKQTRCMIKAAAKQNVFLMEGMWTRFFPAMDRLRRWLAEEHLGRIIAVEADFGVRFDVGPEHRIFNPALGGGALLDLGIYPVSLASMIYGAPPDKIVSVVHKTQTGVDDHAIMTFTYTDQSTAVLSISSIVQLKNEARIYGTKGMVVIDDGFVHPRRMTVHIAGQKPKVMDFAFDGHGMHFEADHVHQCLRKGLLQSDILPLAETLEIMRTMDRIRRQWKLRYPGE